MAVEAMAILIVGGHGLCKWSASWKLHLKGEVRP